jgi:outer membrane protein
LQRGTLCTELAYIDPIEVGEDRAIRFRDWRRVTGVVQMFGVWRNRMMRTAAVFGVAATLVAGSDVSYAESFSQALTKAYRSNPTLQAERARQRGTDELVPQAKSGWRPQISASGSIARQYSDPDPGGDSAITPKTLSIQLAQPLFRGFKTQQGVKQAKETVRAGRQVLLNVEQQVLLQAAQAYMNVLRDREVLSLRQRNVANLQKQANAASARFEAGEVTRTDVSQARSRVSGAKAQVASAKATLAESTSRYVAQIGQKPGTLKRPATAKNPKSLTSALNIARATNPSILAATHTQLAQQHAIEITKGDLLPEASLEASARKTIDPGTGMSSLTTAQVAGVVNIPLYEGGVVYSAVRQAKQLESQRRIEIVSAGRSVVQGVTAAWSYCAAAREAIAAAKAQVAASAEALNGVRQEYLVGSRSTIDVLNAEQEMINAKINLLLAEHDLIVASYQLQASIGRLTARQLGLPGPHYDVEENYENVKDKWIGLDAETVE